MTKAKYYVEWRTQDYPQWHDRSEWLTRLDSVSYASAWANSCKESSIRIRHKGRTIDRWQDGRMVGK